MLGAAVALRSILQSRAPASGAAVDSSCAALLNQNDCFNYELHAQQLPDMYLLVCGWNGLQLHGGTFQPCSTMTVAVVCRIQYVEKP
jgi:hypothetical protein